MGALYQQNLRDNSFVAIGFFCFFSISAALKLHSFVWTTAATITTNTLFRDSIELCSYCSAAKRLDSNKCRVTYHEISTIAWASQSAILYAAPAKLSSGWTLIGDCSGGARLSCEQTASPVIRQRGVDFVLRWTDAVSQTATGWTLHHHRQLLFRAVSELWRMLPILRLQLKQYW